MIIKLSNSKLNDSIVLERDTIEEIREEAKEQIKVRGWEDEDCYSELIK